jgi:hypothetical protein
VKYIDAAIAVLSESREPLATPEIAKRAVERGLLVPGGRTPGASMSAALYLEWHRPARRVIRVAVAGPARAVRGSVRWTLAESAGQRA